MKKTVIITLLSWALILTGICLFSGRYRQSEVIGVMVLLWTAFAAGVCCTAASIPTAKRKS